MLSCLLLHNEQPVYWWPQAEPLSCFTHVLAPASPAHAGRNSGCCKAACHSKQCASSHCRSANLQGAEQ